MEAVGACIRTVLAQPGWSMQRLAGELNVTPDALRKLSRGEVAEPRFSIVAGLHVLANRSVDALLGIDSSSETNAEVLQRISLLENRVNTQELLTAQVMLRLGEKKPEPAASMPVKRVSAAGQKGIAATKGRKPGSALQERTSKKEEAQKRPTRRVS